MVILRKYILKGEKRIGKQQEVVIGKIDVSKTPNIHTFSELWAEVELNS